MSAVSVLRRLGRAIYRTGSAIAGKGLKSAQAFDRTGFLELFDPAIPGGPNVEADDAETALIRHFGERTRSDWPGIPQKITDLRIDLSDMSDDEIVARADAALEHDLHPSGVKPRIRPGNMIDWSANPTANREWLLMLHRHAWWALWGAAYDVTQDEKYAEAFVAQITDWIGRNRMPPRKSEHHAPWRLMECGLRLRLSWIPAFGCFYRSPAFTDEARLLVLRSIYDHCNFLKNFFTNRNHLVRESNGLVAAAVTFPEFRDAETWLTEGIARLDRELQAQVNEDGSHIEMSTGYQWLAIDEFEVTRNLLEPISRTLPSADLDRTLERMYDFLAAVMRPDRCFPQFNDGFILWGADRLASASRDLDRKDLEYVATCGASGQRPAFTSQSFPNAGVHIMRSGWGANSRYLAFDTGPYGGPHGHEDKLSFELCAFGSPFIVDPGSYTYQPDDPYRNYFVGSQGHNTVLVDGASQVRRWNDSHMQPETDDRTYGEWISEENFDWACGTYDEGYAEFSLRRLRKRQAVHSAKHTRQVLFVRPDYWVVVDELESELPHDYSALFHLAPDIDVIQHGMSDAILQSKRTSAKLMVSAISTGHLEGQVINGQESPIQGWYSEDHHKKQPATTLEFTTANARSALLVWILVPFPAGGDIASVEIASTVSLETGCIALDVTIAPASHIAHGRDSISIKVRQPGKTAAAIDITRSDNRHWP